MRHLTYLLLGILCLILTLGACSTTKNLPEGEQLYTGISQITFNDADIKKPKRKQEKADTAGVITAIDNAVQTVGNLFSGTASEDSLLSDLLEVPLTPEEEEARERQEKVFEEHFSVVEEELNAVLSYAPNGAIFGSSSLRSPLQFRLRRVFKAGYKVWIL